METAPRELDRPAFYALRPGGWRDIVTLLHPPYTAWHLSYVALGAAAAPVIHADRLAAALGAFFLAVGISAHALDELNGRPLGTRLKRGTLIALAVTGLIGAVAIGVVGIVTVSPLLIPLVVAGAVLVPAYNLEWFGGAVHTGLGFALAWGAFPALTGYFVEAQTLRVEAIGAAAYATALSLAQRTLSTPVREARRARNTTTGTAPLERALRLLTAATVLLAVGLVAGRLT